MTDIHPSVFKAIKLLLFIYVSQCIFAYNTLSNFERIKTQTKSNND